MLKKIKLKNFKKKKLEILILLGSLVFNVGP